MSDAHMFTVLSLLSTQMASGFESRVSSLGFGGSYFAVQGQLAVE